MAVSRNIPVPIKEIDNERTTTIYRDPSVQNYSVPSLCCHHCIHTSISTTAGLLANTLDVFDFRRIELFARATTDRVAHRALGINIDTICDILSWKISFEISPKNSNSQITHIDQDGL
jgi:hypothetical protein